MEDSWDSVHPSRESFLRSLRNLQLGSGGIESSRQAGTSSLASTSNVSSDQTQQYATHRSDGSWPLLPVPENIWATHSFSNGGNPSLGRGDDMPLDWYHRRASRYSHCQSEAIGNDGFYSNNGYYLRNSPGISGSSSNQEILNTEEPHGDIVKLATMSQASSQYLQEILTSEDPETTDKIVEGVLGFVFELMTDQYGHHLFEKLIESCEAYQMQRITLKIILQRESLINASLDKYGSRSIQKLIKKLKGSPLASKVTSALSTGFDELMIHERGKHVIRQCLNVLDSRQNEVLYEAAIKYCIPLAIHERGCVSLIDCIGFIRGEHRERLLNVIANHSVYLSQEPSGNYVVQHVLGLQNPDFTKTICSNLKGIYIILSLQKNGSHIVEKCLINSLGMKDVVNELLASDKLLQVARDQFGNYVIQRALKTTKCAGSELYRSLLKALQPHLSSLEFHPIGKNVFNLIKSELGSSSQSSISSRSKIIR